MFSHRIARTQRAANRSAILRLEQVEGRTCPSCTVTVTGDTLRIIGDAANDTVSIADNGAKGIVVTCDGVTHPAATGIQHVRVDTGAGDDKVTYTRSATGGEFKGTLDFSAKLGSGNDTFTADFDANGLAGTARVTFDIQGGAGNDTITLNAGTAKAGMNIASGGRLTLNADGGSGKDKIT